MSAYTPDPQVQVAWGFGPYDSPTDPDWVDISTDVNLIETSRGRDRELNPFEPGTMMLDLDNHDRQYDPLNTSGPNYGDLLENVPIRVIANVGGVKPIWRGFVDQWPSSYAEGGYNATTEVPCSDALKLFAERGCPDTFVEDITNFTGIGNMRRWYRFNEVVPGDPAVIRDSLGSGATDLIVTGKWDGQEKIALASAHNALGIAQHTAPENIENRFMGAMRPVGPFDHAPYRTDAWAIACTFRITDQGSMRANPLTLIGILQNSPGPGTTVNDILQIQLHQGWSGGGSHHPSAPPCPGCVSVSVATAGSFNFHATGPGAINDLTNSAPLAGGTFNPFDGKTHTLVVWRHATVLETWADGKLVAKTTVGGATGIPTWDPNRELRVYWPYQGLISNVGNVFPAVIMQELIITENPNLATFSPADLHTVLMTGMHSITSSGTAINTLLTRIGWPLLQRIVDSGETLVETPHNPFGYTVLDLLQQYVDSEGGRMFVDSAGRLIFHAANRFETQTVENTVQYTFTDAGTDVGIDGELRVVVDDDMVFEAAEMQRVNGIRQRASSTSTPNKTFSLSDLRFVTDHQSKQRAERIVHLYSTSKPRTEEYGVWPEADPSDWGAILDLEIGHRVALNLTPGNTGSALSLTQHLELIEHVISSIDWSITMNGSPVDTTNYLVWGGTGATQGWGNGAWR